MTRPLQLFVCSGNLCRSPMAEALAQDRYAREGRDVEVDSAGTLGIRGQPATEHAVEAMRRAGLDIRGHRSRPLGAELVARAAAIVCMAPEHEAAVLRLDSRSRPRIVRLWEHAGALRGIPDPMGEELEAYERSRDLIARGLERWMAGTR